MVYLHVQKRCASRPDRRWRRTRPVRCPPWRWAPVPCAAGRYTCAASAWSRRPTGPTSCRPGAGPWVTAPSPRPPPPTCRRCRGGVWPPFGTSVRSLQRGSYVNTVERHVRNGTSVGRLLRTHVRSHCVHGEVVLFGAGRFGVPTRRCSERRPVTIVLVLGTRIIFGRWWCLCFW